VEIFISGSGGVLSGSFSFPPAAVDLTAEGSVDWAHWGLNLPTDFNHKSVLPQQISSVTVIGTNALQQLSGYPATFNWSDGTPTLNGSTSNGVWVPFLTNGFELVVPAVSYTRTLKVYVGVFAGQGSFQAFLGDFSAPVYVDSSVNSLYDNASGMYTLSFSSPASNQTLHVRYTSQLLYDLQFGNVTLEAATLSGTAPPQPISLLNPAVAEGAFTFLFNSETNRNYAVEYKDSLDPGPWQTFTNIPGTGTSILVGAPLGTGTQRFYRIRIQ
jgi:hypothetical protein